MNQPHNFLDKFNDPLFSSVSNELMEAIKEEVLPYDSSVFEDIHAVSKRDDELSGGAAPIHHRGIKGQLKNHKLTKNMNSDVNLVTDVANHIIKTSNEDISGILSMLRNDANSLKTRTYIERMIQEYVNKSYGGPDYIDESRMTRLISSVINYLKHSHFEKCRSSLPVIKAVFDSTIMSHIKSIPQTYFDFLTLLMAQSSKYLNIAHRFGDMGNNSLFGCNTINFGDYMSLVNPAVVALFGISLPILEELVVVNDHVELFKSMDILLNRTALKDKFVKQTFRNNMSLLKTRSNDTTHFSVNEDFAKSEIRRTELHIALKRVIYAMRKGNFNDNINNLFNSLLDSGRMKYHGFTSTPAGVVASILKMVSLKSIQVIERNILVPGQTMKVPMYLYNIHGTNTITKLDNNFFCFTNPGINANTIVGSMLRRDLLGASMDYKNIACGLLGDQFNDVNRHMSVINADGLFIVDVNRIGYKPSNVVDTRDIAPDLELTINGKNFILRSAICYNEMQTVCGRYRTNNDYYALVRIENDKWFEYNPRILSDVEYSDSIKLKEVVSMIKEYLSFGEQSQNDFTDESIESIKRMLFKYPTLYERAKKIMCGSWSRFSVDSFIKETSEITHALGTTCAVLIYSIDIEPVVCKQEFLFDCQSIA